MSRTAHFGIGLGIALFCVLWCFFCYVWFIGLALGRDSAPGASIFDSHFMALYVVWGAVLLGGLWCAFLRFRRALRPLRLDSPAQASEQVPLSEQQHELATPDERLAHLTKKVER